MERYFQPDIETMPRDQMRALQSERLVKQVRHVWDNVPYYRHLMEEQGVTPDDIRSVDDLHKLPFVSKTDLRDQYPYGLLATDLKNCVRIHSTSGTTGRRVVAFYTQHDVDIWDDCVARAITAAGGTAQDVCQVAYGYGLFTGGIGLHGGAQKVGCLTLPMSSGNTERQIQFMMDLHATMLCCTPSYAAYLGESLKEAGYKPEDNDLRIGIFGAEPWTEEMRREIEASLGIKAYDIYGLTETTGPGVAFECCAQHGMHVNEDHFIPEIIDPDTGEVLPDGEKGELVFTSITKEAFPLLRYRTRDICVLSREKCSCGRTHARIHVTGRKDEMFIVGAVNVFPSDVEYVVRAEKGLTGEYLIRVYDENFSTRYEVSVERAQGSDEPFDAVAARVTAALKAHTGVRPAKVIVFDADKLGTSSEHKASRFIDERGSAK